MPKKYEVAYFAIGEDGRALNDKTWITCEKAEPQSSGWLHYELRDGTIGVAHPGAWREKAAKQVKTGKQVKR